MKLFYAPGACSLGVHILLEEIGKPYEAERVNLKEGEQYREAYVALTPKSKVPALERDDGSVLTEYGAIATWLARTNPDAKLLPADPDAEVRSVEAMDYAVATIHMRGLPGRAISRPTRRARRRSRPAGGRSWPRVLASWRISWATGPGWRGTHSRSATRPCSMCRAGRRAPASNCRTRLPATSPA